MKVVDLRAMRRQAMRHRRLQIATIVISGLLVGAALLVPLFSVRLAVITTVWWVLAAAALVPLLLAGYSRARLQTRRRVLAAAQEPARNVHAVDFDKAWTEDPQ